MPAATQTSNANAHVCTHARAHSKRRPGAFGFQMRVGDARGSQECQAQQFKKERKPSSAQLRCLRVAAGKWQVRLGGAGVALPDTGLACLRIACSDVDLSSGWVLRSERPDRISPQRGTISANGEIHPQQMQ